MVFSNRFLVPLPTSLSLSLTFFSFSKCRVEIGGRTAVVSLIARRSRHFAGTRFLRRGVNDEVFLFIFFFFTQFSFSFEIQILFFRDVLPMTWKQSKLSKTLLELICMILEISPLLYRLAVLYSSSSFKISNLRHKK